MSYFLPFLSCICVLENLFLFPRVKLDFFSLKTNAWKCLDKQNKGEKALTCLTYVNNTEHFGVSVHIVNRSFWSYKTRITCILCCNLIFSTHEYVGNIFLSVLVYNILIVWYSGDADISHFNQFPTNECSVCIFQAVPWKIRTVTSIFMLLWRNF